MDASQVFKTKWGWMGLGASSRGIARIVLPRPSRRSVEFELGPGKSGANGHLTRPASSRQRAAADGKARGTLKHAQQQLLRFLSGAQQGLGFPIDLKGATRFQRRVWLAAQRISYGRVRSYQWIATRVGGKQYARAVGLALGANPVPLVVPCHRVVAHDGSLGGFAGGLRLKRRLLQLEGACRQLSRKVESSKSQNRSHKVKGPKV